MYTAIEHIRMDVFEKVEKLNIELAVPRQYGRQTHRSNLQRTNVEEYFRLTVSIPYLDSLISSLLTRFSENNSAHFDLSLLRPTKIGKRTRIDYIEKMSAGPSVHFCE